MQYELEKFLFSWDFCYASDTLLPTDDYVNVFNQHINLALHNSLPKKGSRTAQQTSFFWDSILFKLHCHENQSFLAFKHANDADKSRLRILWRQSKRTLRKAVAKLERKEERNKIRYLESLKSKDPRAYWKGLYQLEDSAPVDSKLPLHVKDSNNAIVTGDAACKAWINSFAKLGDESSDFYDFDTPFYYRIQAKVKNYYQLSFTQSSTLDAPITLEELKPDRG